MKTQREQDTCQTTASTEARTGKRKSKPSKPKVQRDSQTLIIELFDAWAHQNVKGWATAYLRQRPLPLLLLGPTAKEGEAGALAGEEHDVTAAEIDAVLENLDQGIAAEQAAMDRLLQRMASRTPR